MSYELDENLIFDNLTRFLPGVLKTTRTVDEDVDAAGSDDSEDIGCVVDGSDIEGCDVGDKSAEGLAACITEQLKLVLNDDNEKLIAQTYDGAAVLSAERGGVQEILKQTYKNAHFIHCYAHQLNLVVEKAASRNQVVNTVFENKDALIKCFQTLQNDQNPATILGASELLGIFENENFNFWLNFFHEIMPHVDILYTKLQLKDANALTVHEGVDTLIKTLRGKRDKLSSIDDLNFFPPQKRIKYYTANNIIAAIEVCDYIASQIEERFKFTNHILSTEVDKTVKAYPMLDKQRLKMELHALYELHHFKNINSVYKIYNLFRDTGVGNSLIQVFAVLKIIVTTPMTTAEPERCFSALNSIKSFLRNSMGQDRLTALAMISIEKEMIGEIPDFNRKVIDKFAELKNRRMEFNFK
ncbi:zinc finger MYM-type protein 1-like [Arctopsyche grandis]|uniref:zinc finger MYM-type protein 1-like n=1 Tax=Arctopsyche grandis TaxID=121162 RepID=UPI00406D90CC